MENPNLCITESPYYTKFKMENSYLCIMSEMGHLHVKR